jgi:L-ascorbate metabolism protein UlaG (beta-lactamase superfamily)
MRSTVHLEPVKATYIGGPTILLEVAGLRLLTDPTFDPPGGAYTAKGVTLSKNGGPAIPAWDIGPIDAVLLSHDHHADNLDETGRALLAEVPAVFTTAAGASRLGDPAVGLLPWQSAPLASPTGQSLLITATPARHGPAGIEPIIGDVIGFILSVKHGGTFEEVAYITGDTVWYSGVEEVARRIQPAFVLIFAGAAQPRGPFDVTMNTNDAIETAVSFPRARIIPLHHEGWKHLTEDAEDLKKAFGYVGLENRLQILRPGEPTRLEPMD